VEASLVDRRSFFVVRTHYSPLTTQDSLC